MKTKNDPAQNYIAAQAKRAELEHRLEMIEKARSQAMPTIAHAMGDRLLDPKRVELLEAKIAVDEAATAYDSSAGDVAAIVAFLRSHLESAAEALAIAASVEKPAPLAAVARDALEARVQALDESAREARRASAADEALATLARAYFVAREGYDLARRARDTAGLPRMPSVVPPTATHMGVTFPVNAAEISAALAYLESVPKATDSGAAMALEVLRSRIRQDEAREAKEAERALSPRDRLAADLERQWAENKAKEEARRIATYGAE